MDGPYGTAGSKTSDNLQQPFLGQYTHTASVIRKHWLLKCFTPHEVWEVKIFR
jgi:hypothetical protein